MLITILILTAHKNVAFVGHIGFWADLGFGHVAWHKPIFADIGKMKLRSQFLTAGSFLECNFRSGKSVRISSRRFFRISKI